MGIPMMDGLGFARGMFIARSWQEMVVSLAPLSRLVVTLPLLRLMQTFASFALAEWPLTPLV